MLDLLLHTSPEPIFIYDIEDLKFLEVNPAALKIYGYSQEEFFQMDLTDLYAPDDIQTLLDSSNAKNKEKVFTGPWKHRKKDGTTILVEISKLSFIYKGKKAHFNIVRDVTEKVKLLKESRIFQATFNHIDDLIFITDTEGFIQQTNEAVYSVLNYNENELLNMPILTLLPDEDRANTNTNIFIAKLKKTTNFELELKKQDGTFLKGKIICTPIFDFNNFLISYSLQFKPEKSLQENITSQITTDSDKKSLSPSKGTTVDFSLLSSMFHEILTPLNVILGFTQEIGDTIENKSAEQKEAIDIIDQNRAILLHSMDEILEFAQLESVEIEYEIKNVTFTDILTSIQENTKKASEKLHVELLYGKISSSLVIETDFHKLEELVTLLVKMSMRLTKEKMIIISAYHNDDQSCIISVRDSRGNISSLLHEKLNDIFLSTNEDISLEFGISKVSLGLAKKLLAILSGKVETIKKGDEINEFGFILPLKFSPLIQNQESDIKVVIQEAKKDTVEELNKKALPVAEPKPFSIPVNPAPPIQKNMVPPEQRPMPRPVTQEPKLVSKTGKVDFSQMQCLYIEDQVDSQTLFKVQMKDLKSVDFAFNFDFALPLLREKKYNFIVIDINLQSQFNGIEVLKLIRSMPGYERTPIIAVTAYLLPGDKEKFIASGFNGFVSKPILRNKILDVLEKIMVML